MFIKLILVASFAAVGLAAPLVSRAANPCFVTGKAALPAEVASGLSTLAESITCNNTVQVAPGVPDVTSGGISFSSIDFQKSTISPLGFALATFGSGDPKTANLDVLQNQLNVYRAFEAGVSSQGNQVDLLSKLQAPKMLLKLHIAHVNQVQGKTPSGADTVGNVLGKLLTNSIGASPSELAQVLDCTKFTGH